MATFTESLASRQAAASAYAAGRPWAALFSADPGNASGAATNELTGGSPAYARVAVVYGVVDATAKVVGVATVNVPPGATVNYVGLATAATGATIAASFAVSPVTFVGQNVYTATFVLQF